MSNSKIIRLQIENVKRIKAVDITPEDNLITIGGLNGQGKTSILDSIAMVLGGGEEIPVLPVRKGAEKAKIIATLDGGLIVRRTFTAAGGTTLVVESADGAQYKSPQAILDKLAGKITFDPLGFTRLDSKKQRDALQRLVGVDFTELDGQIAEVYAERKLVNREIDNLKPITDKMPYFSGIPAKEVSAVELMEEAQKAGAHNQKGEQLRSAIQPAELALASTDGNVSKTTAEIKGLEDRIKALKVRLAAEKEKLKEFAETLKRAEQASKSFVPVDVGPINKKLAEQEETNRQIRANASRNESLKTLAEKNRKSDAFTVKLKALEEKKNEQLASVKYPVKGLSFDENGVTFKGIPFEQSSSAEQLKVSVTMAAALNPKLKVMLVRDGSLLDDDSLKLLGELAREHELQVWLEKVGEDEAVSVIIEDGMVVSQ